MKSEELYFLQHLYSTFKGLTGRQVHSWRHNYIPLPITLTSLIELTAIAIGSKLKFAIVPAAALPTSELIPFFSFSNSSQAAFRSSSVKFSSTWSKTKVGIRTRHNDLFHAILFLLFRYSTAEISEPYTGLDSEVGFRLVHNYNYYNWENVSIGKVSCVEKMPGQSKPSFICYTSILLGNLKPLIWNTKYALLDWFDTWFSSKESWSWYFQIISGCLVRSSARSRSFGILGTGRLDWKDIQNRL